MHQNRTDVPLSMDVDPDTARLNSAVIVEIHRQHRAGVAWGEIARQHNISRKYVGRIVRGLRWPDFHPSRRPDLYGDSPAAIPPTYTAEQIDAAVQVGVEAFRAALRRMCS